MFLGGPWAIHPARATTIGDKRGTAGFPQRGLLSEARSACLGRNAPGSRSCRVEQGQRERCTPPLLLGVGLGAGRDIAEEGLQIGRFYLDLSDAGDLHGDQVLVPLPKPVEVPDPARPTLDPMKSAVAVGSQQGHGLRVRLDLDLCDHLMKIADRQIEGTEPVSTGIRMPYV